MPDVVTGAVVGGMMLGSRGGGGGLSLGQTLGAILQSQQKQAKAPAMPIADDATVQAAKRRSLLRQTQRRGRASTILTGDNETLG